MTERTTTRFLNVDLDLKCGRGAKAELMRCLGSRMLLLHSEKDLAIFEHSQSPKTPEQGILLIAAVVRKLPRRARAQWNDCERRTMNIGVHAGTLPHEAHFPLGSEALRALTEMGADVLVTVYAPSST
jgi:hypothetical protein